MSEQSSPRSVSPPTGKAKPDDAVSTLSVGWHIKLARLASAMLQRAVIVLLDELTNNLHVISVCWVEVV